MMIKRIGKPYVWVTWITGYLSEDDRCYWRAWVQAHYQSYPKPEKTPEEQKAKDQFLSEWNRKHDNMVLSRAERMRQEGYQVLVEREGKFALSGAVATLGGQPDVIGLQPQHKEAIIVDAKSGKKKSRYPWQVRLYQFAKGLTSLKEWKIRGEVEYADEVVPVEPIDDSHIQQISKVLKIVGGAEEPKRVPSQWECEYCDIVSCPDRWQPTDASKFF
jgi:hypothetical protein